MKFDNLEEIFKASQETLNQFLITQLPINIFLVNTEGYVCWANKNLLNYVNINSLEDVIGMHISHWDKCRWDAIQEVLKTKQESIVEEFYNGTFFSSVRKPVIQNGKLIGVLGLSIDITEKKQSEIAKQKFIMNMAHDLRTPLAGIIGLANIQADQGTNAQERQYGLWILTAGEQLLELLNAVLKVIDTEQMIDSIKAEPIHLTQLAKELQTLMQPSIEAKKLAFELKLDTHLPTVISDQIKLKRLLLNLLSNAVKFTKEGKVSLEMDLLSLEENQAKIEIRVTDTGIGIEKDKINKIFDRFYRAHPSYKAEYAGYGIGLFLVKQALELLSGEIKVSSVEGKGSCFTLEFNFPLAEGVRKQASSVISQKSPLPIEADTKKNSVLVIEDNTLVLFAIKNVLNNLGYEVTTVTEGKAALQVLQSQSFDWVLLDIGLPDLEGTEVVRIYRQWELENKKPHLPIFVLTAHEDEKIKEKCQEIDIDYILKKPFTENDILMIKKYIK